jgi:hypothetical protein
MLRPFAVAMAGSGCSDVAFRAAIGRLDATRGNHRIRRQHAQHHRRGLQT